MIAAQFLGQIVKILKKWLSRLTRSSPSLIVSLLFKLLRGFAAYLSRLGDRPTYFTGATSIQDGRAIKDVFICSFLPGRKSSKVIGHLPSLSDDPYVGTHSTSLRKMYKHAAEPYGLPLKSMSSLNLSQQTGESPLPGPSRRIPYDQKGKGVERGSKRSLVDNGMPMQASTSPQQSPFLGPYGLSAASQGRTLSVTSHDGSLYHSAPSVATSRSRASDYRRHIGPVHSRPVSIRGSLVDLRHGLGPGPVSGIDHYYHQTAPPGTSGDEPGTHVVSEYDGPPIGAMVADGVQRYARCNPRATDNSITTVPAMTVTFPMHDPDVPSGWITVVHPEGCRYFVNPKKRTFTEINICEKDYRDDVEGYMEYLLYVLELELKLKNLNLDLKHVDLVIEPKNLNGTVVGNYYFANHRDRCLFWLDDFDAKDVIDCKGIRSLSHRGLAIQAQYWRHWDYFPSLCPVAQNLIDEAENMLVHATCDHLSSRQSSAAYDIDELRDYLSVIKRIKVPPADKCIEQCHAAIVIGRIMHVFSRNAFINFHGEDCARLSYDQTVHGWVYKPSWWMIFFAPVLFLEPMAQVQELHKIFADHTVRTSRWNAFSSRLKGQLQNSNILATVLLNANVAFLGASKGGKNAIQVASYMSLVASFGSIVLGLFFVSQDRTSGQSTADEAGSFLSDLHHTDRGLQSLAIIYSLPKALLMWGMMFFFVAFSMYWYMSGDMVSRVLISVLTLLVLGMIGISIIRAKEGDHWWPMTREIMSIKRAKTVDNKSEMGGDAMEIPAGPLEANSAVDDSPRSPLPSLSNFTASTASVHSPRRRNDGSSMLHSPHLRPSASFLSGVSSGYIPEDTQTVSQVQPIGEVHYEREPDRAHPQVHFTTPSVVDVQLQSDDISTKAITPSEHEGQIAAVVNDSHAVPVRERGDVETLFEEPEEQLPQDGDSTSSLPRFLGKAPTGDDFRYALQADDRDIAETQDE